MNSFPVTASTLSEIDLGIFIMDRYSLPETSHCKLFRTGINHTYFITNTEAKHVVRVYCYNWRTLREIEEELKLLVLLKNENLSVSFPIADKNGDFIQEINAPEGKRYVVLFSFAVGDKIRFMDNETCFEIGKIMANMHKITTHKKIDRVQYTNGVLLEKSYNYLKSFFNEDLESMKLFKSMSEIISGKFDNYSLNERQKGIVHLDIWYDNLSVASDREITLFDFDNCGNGPFILDIGYFCKQLFFIESDKNNYELKKSHFLNGYQSERKLLESEIALLPEAGASIFLFYLGVQAQRFDWSNIFLSENYLNMLVGRIKSWMDYHDIK
ncbi:phosphotransferase [Bizionia myxarmorum]|uniref:Phosphotransferase n=1 Tax=Bizionia myxarmorum TaxID=291186 RepID=A0A5D0R4M7_9FLAO|nr:phosphotransferase [Bizionia myxarmorum]TYB75821.1 phosphotransferase [Bizionia myxarmorum]